MEIDLKKIEALMEAMGRHEIALVKIKEGEQEIKLEHARGKAVAVAAPMAVAPALSAPAPAKEAAPVVESGISIPSPMVGTFYRAPSPDSEPFVKEGDTVSEETVVCIIEAMKVMNEVKAGISGTIAKAKLKDGDPVEFGSELFLVS